MDSGLTALKSTCRMCHGGCSTLLHLRDGRLVKIEGDPDGPLNHGHFDPVDVFDFPDAANPTCH